MAKGHPVQTNFTGGEISPSMYGRVDVKKYQNGASRMRNSIPRPQGGASRRPGSTKMAKGWLGSNRIKLLPFIFSDQQKYLMEFGENYIHFHRNREPLLESTNMEVEGFTVTNNGGFFQLNVRTSGSNFPDDLPALGDINTFYSPANNGTVIITAGAAGAVRLTSSIPHTLRTGSYVLVRTNTAVTSVDGVNKAITNVQNNGAGLYRITVTGHGYITGNKVIIRGTGTTADNVHWTITMIDANNFDLQGSTFGSTGATGVVHRIWQINRISNFAIDLVGSTFGAPGAGQTAYFYHGIFPGDRIFVSGGPEYPELSEKYHYVKSVESLMSWTIANLPYVNHGGVTGEEVHVIPIEVPTPYLTADVQALKVSQSADVVYITHPSYPTRKLARLDTDGDRNDWLIAAVDFFDGPYLPLNDISPNVDTVTPANGARYYDVYLEVSAYTHTANVTAFAAFGGADNGKYLEFRDRDQWRLAQLVTGQGTSAGTVTVIDNVLLYIDETAKLKSTPDKPTYIPGSPNSSATNNYLATRNTAYRNKFQQQLDNRNSLDGTTAAGDITSQYSNTFATADVGKYVRYGTTANPPVFHWALIDGLSGTTGSKAHHAIALSTTPGMVANNATGKFIISNEVRSCTVKSFRAGVAFNMFLASDVGRHIRFGFGGRWVWGKISAFTSASQVTVLLQDDPPRDPHNALNIAGNQDPANPNSGLTNDWRLGAWSTSTGYPAVSVFHEQRLWFGRTTVEPQTQWGSRSGDYENMSPTEPDGTVLDSNGVTYTIVSGKVSPIKWMVSGPVLLTGGQSQEWQARSASTTQEPISQTNISVTPQTSFGSADNVPAQAIGPATIFADKVGRKVREMVYNFELDRHVATDLSIVASHLFKQYGPIQDSEYQKHPFGIYWAVDTFGLMALTYERDHEVVAWSRHDIKFGFVESICVLPTYGVTADPASVLAFDNDEVYIAVRRFINGSYSVFIEVMYLFDFEASVPTDNKWQQYLDGSVLLYIPGGTTAINGLDHYEGETLQVLADGVYIGNKTVTGGAFTLSVAAEIVRVGYNFESLVGILPPEGGALIGTAQTKTKRVNKVGVRLSGTTSFKSSSAEAGPYQPHQMESVFFTGDVTVPLEQGYGPSGAFFFKQDLPEPMTILLVAPELATYEEQ